MYPFRRESRGYSFTKLKTCAK
uniref:Uncharacterized protein n=1 Tax=Arundo donax TaxID=35708 RepID=A0A0A9FS34_ARUDO